MSDVRMALSTPMVLARSAGCKTVTRRLVTRANSVVDGEAATAEEWARLDWSRAYVQKTGPAWVVSDKDGYGHVVTPRLAPGDILLWGEATHECPAGFVRYDADDALVMEGKEAAGWLKQDGSPYAVSRLSATYCPRAWVRYRDRVVSVKPSTSAEVNTPEEAMAEGLCIVDWTGWDVWSWRGSDQRFDTPASAYSALLESLHGSPVPASAPMWRVAFEPVEATR